MSIRDLSIALSLQNQDQDDPLASAATLLQATHNALLHNLRTDHADAPFPSQTHPPNNDKPPADHYAAAAALLDLELAAAKRLFDDYEADAHNDAQAFKRAALAESAPAEPLALLTMELALLRHLHEQRCLLLRCVRQLVAICLDGTTHPLHAVASGHLSLLFEERLAARLCELATLAPRDEKALALERLPHRLREAPTEARCHWLSRVAEALAAHAVAERLELLSLLALCHDAPVQIRAGLTLAEPADARLLEQQLKVAQRQLDPRAVGGARAARLVAVATLSAVRAEHSKAAPLARSSVLTARHQRATAMVLELAENCVQTGCEWSAGAAGAIALAWCAVQLDCAPASEVADIAARLATAAEQCSGLAWLATLFGADGFCACNTVDELSFMAASLALELASNLVEQDRGCQPANIGWPADAESLLRLATEAVRGRSQLCAAFWDNVDSGESLASLLHGTRYPLEASRLPCLLAALCADGDSAARAWAHIAAIRGATHRLPRRLSLLDVRRDASSGSVRAMSPLSDVGAPPLSLPEGAEGLILEEEGDHESGALVVRWRLPRSSAPLSMAGLLIEAARAALRGGGGAIVESGGASALELLAAAPRAMQAAELARIFPPAAELVSWLEAAAASGVDALFEPTVRLVGAVAPLAALHVRAALVGSSQLIRLDTPLWLPRFSGQILAPLISLLEALVFPDASEPMGTLSEAAYSMVAFALVHVVPALGDADAAGSLRGRVRICEMLSSIMDYAGAEAASHEASAAGRIATMLLDGAAAQTLILDPLRATCGRWRTALHHASRLEPTNAAARAALSAMADLGASSIGLLLRMLVVAHNRGASCGLHSMMLHQARGGSGGPEAADGAGPLRWLAQCALPSHPMEEERTGALSDVRPLAVRCLSLLLHANARHGVGARLIAAIGPIAPALSAQLSLWIGDALPLPDNDKSAEAGASQPLAGLRLGSDTGLLGGAAERASAALQLLSAAASTSTTFFSELCGGPLQPGDAVLLLADGPEPESGRGLVKAGVIGRLIEIGSGVATVDFPTHEAWFTSNFSCLARASAHEHSLDAPWVSWKSVKEQLEAASAAASGVPEASPARMPALPEPKISIGPLTHLLRLLGESYKHGESEPGAMSSALVEAGAADGLAWAALQLQAVSVVRAVWQQPAAFAAAFDFFANSDSFWRTIGRCAQAPSADGTTGASVESSLRRTTAAVALDILLQQVRRGEPPAQLSDAVVGTLRSLYGWVESSASILAPLLTGSPYESGDGPEVERQASRLGCSPPRVVEGYVFVECGQLAVARGVLPPAEVPSVLPVWVGGAGAPLPDAEGLRLFDVASLRLRYLQSLVAAKQALGPVTTANSVAPRVAAESAAVAAAADAYPVDSGASLLARLDHLQASSMLDERSATRRTEVASACLQLIDAAASANAHALARSSRRSLARRWRLFIASSRSDACVRIPRARVVDLASKTQWLRVHGGGGGASFERLRARASELATDQRARADECGRAALLLRHAQSMLAIATYLEQQALALEWSPLASGATLGTGNDGAMPASTLAWALAEWKRASSTESATFGYGSEPRPRAILSRVVGGSPPKRPKTTLQQSRALALEATLDDSGVLARLASYLRQRLDDAASSVAGLDMPDAISLVASVKAELSEAHARLRASAKVQLSQSPDGRQRDITLAELSKGVGDTQLLTRLVELSERLAAEARQALGFCSAAEDGITMDAAEAAKGFEVRARSVGLLLDASDAALQAHSRAVRPPGSPAPFARARASSGAGRRAAGDAHGVAQLLDVTPASAGAKHGVSRRQHLHAAVRQLLHCEEELLRQADATITFNSADSPASAGARAMDKRREALEAIRARIASSSEAIASSYVAACFRDIAAVQASLRDEATRMGMAAQAATARASHELRGAADALRREQAHEALDALGDVGLQRKRAKASEDALALLWRRCDGCAAVEMLLQAAQGGDSSALAEAAARAADAAEGLHDPEAAPVRRDGDPKALLGALVGALLVHEEHPVVARGVQRVRAALRRRAADVRALACFTAIALHFEESQMVDDPLAPLEVCVLGASPSMTFVARSADEMRIFEPSGWIVDGHHRALARMPSSLQAVLFPTQGLRLPLSAESASALGAVAVALAAELEQSAVSMRFGGDDSSADHEESDGATALLSTVDILVHSSVVAKVPVEWRDDGDEPPPALLAADVEQLVGHIARALVAVGSGAGFQGALPAMPMASLALLLRHRDAISLPPEVTPLLSLLISSRVASVRSQHPRSKAHAELHLALIATLASTYGELGEHQPVATHWGAPELYLLEHLLPPPRGASGGESWTHEADVLHSLLMPLLALARFPKPAGRLLDSGLLPRLAALARNLGACGDGSVLDAPPAPERSTVSIRACWCAVLDVATAALVAVGERARTWLPAALDFVRATEGRMRKAITGVEIADEMRAKGTLAALHEQRAATRLAARVVDVSNRPLAGLETAISKAVENVAHLLLLPPAYFELVFPPANDVERARARRSPLGQAVLPPPRGGSCPAGTVEDSQVITPLPPATRGGHTDALSLHAVEARLTLFGTLSAALEATTASAARPEALQPALTAAVSLLRAEEGAPAVMVGTSAAVAASSVEGAMRAASIRCVALAAALSLKAATERRKQLGAAATLAASHDHGGMTRFTDENEAHVRECADILSRLPSALRTWVEGVADGGARRLLTSFASEEVQRAVDRFTAGSQASSTT